MWKLKRTQKYLIEIIHTWVRNKGVERGGEGGIWSFGRALKEQTNQKQKQKTQAGDKDMGLFGNGNGKK